MIRLSDNNLTYYHQVSSANLTKLIDKTNKDKKKLGHKYLKVHSLSEASLQIKTMNI